MKTLINQPLGRKEKIIKIVKSVLITIIVILSVIIISNMWPKPNYIFCHNENTLLLSDNSTIEQCTNVKIVSKDMKKIDLKVFKDNGLICNLNYDSLDKCNESYEPFYREADLQEFNSNKFNFLDGKMCAEYFIRFAENSSNISFNYEVKFLVPYNLSLEGLHDKVKTCGEE